jgi:t-SNARE complex subunit (syntaxin)
MTNWKSPEVAETWRAQLQNLNKEIDVLQERILTLSRETYQSILLLFVSTAPTNKRKYLQKRRDHYSKLIDNATNESEMAKCAEDFVEKYQTYLAPS